MADSLNISGDDAVKKALQRIPKLAAAAADKAVAMVAHAYEAELKSNRVLQGVQNNGRRHIGPAGGFPNRRTGNLARSIEVQHVGLGTYKVGSGAIYSRSLELGNPKWRSGVRYPFMEPTAAFMRPKAQKLFTYYFRQNFRQG
jgi:hypothetical protein